MMLVSLCVIGDGGVVSGAIQHRIWKHTQLRLKQSCEQKKLSLISTLRHVGHCKVPASSVQSTPKHFRFAGGSEVILEGDAYGICGDKVGGKCSQVRLVYGRTIQSSY